MTPIETRILAFLTERRRQGEGWTSIAEIRAEVKPATGSNISHSLSMYSRVLPGVESRGGWGLGQQFQVRMKEVPS